MEQIIELEKKKMDVLREIADINLLISEKRAEILQLTKDKENYLFQRDNEVLGRIHKLLNNSRILLDEVKSNYGQISEFHESVKQFCKFITDIQDNLIHQINDFNEKSVLWKKTIDEKEEEISELRKEIKREQESMEREKNFIKRQRAILEKDKSHLESQQATLQTSYNELKKLWERIQK